MVSLKNSSLSNDAGVMSREKIVSFSFGRIFDTLYDYLFWALEFRVGQRISGMAP
jgi:hypothetical protein